MTIVRTSVTLTFVERTETFTGGKMPLLVALIHIHAIDIEAQNAVHGQIGANIDHEAGEPVHTTDPLWIGPLLKGNGDTGFLSFLVWHTHTLRAGRNLLAYFDVVADTRKLFSQKCRSPEFRQTGFGVPVEFAAYSLKLFLSD